MAFAKWPVGGTNLDLKDLKTTGSMSASSNTLTVASNPGFQIGDPIIVEIGGESGLGLRGTDGVGGRWPALSYANEATMDADVSKPANTFASVDTNPRYVYRFNDPNNTWVRQLDEEGFPSFYQAYRIPKSLVTTITNISGNTFTLQTAATNATTNANVYYDNWNYLHTRFQSGSGFTPDINRWNIPRGKFAISDVLSMMVHPNWQLVGQGMEESEIFSPKGVPSAHLFVFECPRAIIRDFHLKGNARTDGYGLSWGISGAVTETQVNQGNSWPAGILFSASDYAIAQDMKITDSFQMAIGASFCYRAWAKRCKIFITDEIPQYVQWQLLWADSAEGGSVDCSGYSTYLTGGPECFNSIAAGHYNWYSENMTGSINSSGGSIYYRPTFIIKANTQGTLGGNASHSASNPILNINSNQQPNSTLNLLGSSIIDPIIIQEGFINPTTKNRCVHITVNENCANVKITSNYKNDQSRGYLRCDVPWESPGQVHSNMIRIAAASGLPGQHLIKGIRIQGGESDTSFFGHIHLEGTAPNVLVQDCVRDHITGVTGSVSQSGNETNAEWEA